MSNLIISSRVDLYRNYSDIPFDTPECEEDGNKVNQRCLSVINDESQWKMCSARQLTGHNKADIADIRRMPFEDNVCATSAFFINQSEGTIVETNSGDHIHIQAVSSDGELREKAEKCRLIACALETAGIFAFSNKLGFTTRDLQNIGCGMTASYMVHLPNLSALYALEKYRSDAANIGVAITPADGFPPTFALYSVHNQTCIGIDESEIIDNVMTVALRVIDAERDAAEKYEDGHPKKILDAAMRAIALMKSAVIVDGVWELGEWWSGIRRAAEAGQIDQVSLSDIDKIMDEGIRLIAAGADGQELADKLRKMTVVRE